MTYSHQRLSALSRSPLIDAARVKSLAQRVTEVDFKQRLFRLENAAATDALRLYRKAFDDIRSAAHSAADALSLTTLDNSKDARRFRDAWLDWTTKRLQRLTNDVAASALRYATAGYVGGYYARLWQLDVSTRPDVRIKVPTLRIEAVATHLADMREDAYDDLIQSLLGKEWRQQYATELDDLTLRIRRALGNGMQNGDGIDALVRQVRDEMGIVTDRRRGTAGSAQRAGYRANFNRVQTLTRTVVNSASNNGAISAYEANDDILSGYTWLAANDERVCPECSALDGTEYDFGDTTRPPAHPSCRCTVIPVIAKQFRNPDDAAPGVSLDMWAHQFGMDAVISDFLNPAA